MLLKLKKKEKIFTFFYLLIRGLPVDDHSLLPTPSFQQLFAFESKPAKKESSCMIKWTLLQEKDKKLGPKMKVINRLKKNIDVYNFI